MISYWRLKVFISEYSTFVPERVELLDFGMDLLTSPIFGAGSGRATALTKATQRKTEASEKRILL